MFPSLKRIFFFPIQKDRNYSLAIALSIWGASIALEHYVAIAKGLNYC